MRKAGSSPSTSEDVSGMVTGSRAEGSLISFARTDDGAKVWLQAGGREVPPDTCSPSSHGHR